MWQRRLTCLLFRQMKLFETKPSLKNVYILTYHHVCDEWLPTAARVTTRQFEKHIRTLLGEDVLFLSEMDLLNPERVPEKRKKVMLTFDDGFACLYRHAFPILQMYKIPALVFIVTGYVGQFSAWDVNFFSRKPTHLNWSEILEMQRYGISFGSHTHTHKNLRAVDSSQVLSELKLSKSILENKLGQSVQSLSYPFGRHSESIHKQAAELGYHLGFTLAPGNQFRNPLSIPRLGVYLFDVPFFFRLKTSPSRLRRLEYLKLKITNFCATGTIVTKKILR